MVRSGNMPEDCCLGWTSVEGPQVRRKEEKRWPWMDERMVPVSHHELNPR